MERRRFVITLCFRQLVSIFTQTERKTFFGKSSRNQIRKKTSNSIFLLLKPKTPRVKRYQRGQQLLRLFFVFFDKNETCCINFFSRILFFRLGGVVFFCCEKNTFDWSDMLWRHSQRIFTRLNEKERKIVRMRVRE